MGRDSGGQLGRDRDLPRLVRELRQQAGLSVRELARRMGVGGTTLSALELGQRQPRLSTLSLLAAHLPGATARLLLAPASQHPEPASPAAWTFAARQFGFTVDRATYTIGGEGSAIEMEGIRTQRACPSLLLAIARAVCVGGPEFRASLASLEQVAGHHEDGALTHEFVVSPSQEVLNYKCTRDAVSEDTFAVRVPVRELRLRVRCHRAAPADFMVRVYRQARGVEDSMEIGGHVHPAGIPIKRDPDCGSLMATVSWPFIGASYALAPRTATRDGERPATLIAGGAVRLARVEAGMSERELARRAGLPQPTVREVERGSDPRLSTLQGLLLALPSLSPQQVLAGGDPAAFSAGDYWQHAVRFFGLRAKEILKVVEIERDGMKKEMVRTRGLVAFGATGADSEIRVGLRRALLQQSPKQLAEIEATDAEVKMRHVPLDDGRDIHSFRFGSDLAERGVSYTRRYSHAGKYTLTQADAQRKQPQEYPHRAGGELPILFPVEVCRLTIVLPPGYEPRDPRAHRWPSSFLPDEPLMLDGCLPQGRVHTSRRQGRLAVHLSARRPIPGTTCALSWELP